MLFDKMVSDIELGVKSSPQIVYVQKNAVTWIEKLQMHFSFEVVSQHKYKAQYISGEDFIDLFQLLSPLKKLKSGIVIVDIALSRGINITFD